MISEILRPDSPRYLNSMRITLLRSGGRSALSVADGKLEGWDERTAWIGG
jgi:hypothetical protein